MKVVPVLLLSALLAPLAGLAQSPAPAAVLVPDTVTTAGEKFAANCDDGAFRQATDPDKLARRCQRLLAQWHAEAAQREARRANPRIDTVAYGTPSPTREGVAWGDTPAMDWSRPLQASYANTRQR